MGRWNDFLVRVGIRPPTGQATAESVGLRANVSAVGSGSSNGMMNMPLPVSSTRVAHVQQDPLAAMGGGALYWAVSPPVDANAEWAVQDLDAAALTSMPADELLTLLARISPEVSKAYWDFVVYVGNAVEVSAFRPGTQDSFPAAENALTAFMERLSNQHNSFLHAVHQVIAGGFLRGAFAAELVLDSAGRRPLNLATPDPALFRFRRRDDEELGQVWDLGQVQANGQFVSFEELETVKYVPILPNVGGPPYGVSWVEPALFPAVFLLALLHDLRRVVANQGYSRQDIVVELERLRASMPASIQADPEAWKDWVNGTIDEVSDAYAALQPDDAWVHTDVAVLNQPVGVLGQTNMTTAVNELMMSIERMMVRALKTIPFLLAARQTTTETQANREWEAFTAGIGIIQRKLGEMLDRLLTLSLEAQGIAADVVVEFGQLQETDRMRRAQTEEIEIRNAAAKVAQGWIDNDQAAEEITGSPAVGQPVGSGQSAVGSNGRNTAEREWNYWDEFLGNLREANAELTIMEMHVNGQSG